MGLYIAIFISGAAFGMLFQRVLLYIAIDTYNPTMCDWCQLKIKKSLCKRKTPKASRPQGGKERRSHVPTTTIRIPCPLKPPTSDVQ